MPAASYRILHSLFAHHLHFTPTQGDIDQFEADLAVVSPTLMKASLVELAVGRSRVPVGTGAWRDAIFSIYNRKVAEHTQLFPAFHCFETAFRSSVAVTLEEHYKISQWWTPLNTQIRGGPAASTIGVVHNVPKPRLRSILILVEGINSISRLDVMSFSDGYELLAYSTLSQIRRIVESHWNIFKVRFITKNQPMPLNVFLDKFDKVESARNNVYHHRSFGGMTPAYNAANDLLSCLNFPLPAVHKRISETSCQRPPYF